MHLLKTKWTITESLIPNMKQVATWVSTLPHNSNPITNDSHYNAVQHNTISIESDNGECVKQVSFWTPYFGSTHCPLGDLNEVLGE